MIDLDRIEHMANAALVACEVNALGKIVGRDVPALVARVRELEALLREVEWEDHECLFCGGQWSSGHESYCPWVAAMGTGTR